MSITEAQHVTRVRAQCVNRVKGQYVTRVRAQCMTGNGSSLKCLILSLHFSFLFDKAGHMA